MNFRVHPVNFTTTEVMLEACGLAGLGPSNNDGGNPLEGLEGLILQGTLHTKAGLVTDGAMRVAYVPDPHFNGADSFQYVGDDLSAPCTGLECLERQTLKVSTVQIEVPNTNDTPEAPLVNIVARVGFDVVIDLVGSDALIDDPTLGWEDLSKRPAETYSGGHPIRLPDYSGKVQAYCAREHSAAQISSTWPLSGTNSAHVMRDGGHPAVVPGYTDRMPNSRV